MSAKTNAESEKTADELPTAHLELECSEGPPPAAAPEPPVQPPPAEEPGRGDGAPLPAEAPPATPAGVLLGPEQIAALQVKAAQATEHWDRFVRMAADFENFKKRAVRERQDAVKFANEALLSKLVAVLDNFDTALAAGGNPEGVTVESFRAGVAMINSQLKGVLAEAGLETIEAAGQAFNPNLHEAVAQQESAAVPEGQVLQQLRRGYKYRDRLLRPATVVVAKKPAA